MRITPLDIRKQEFRKTMRGLDGDEVYAFLSTVADEYEAVLSDNKRLREHIVQLEERLKEFKSMETNLRNTLMTAEKITAEAKDNARKEADLIVRGAEVEAAKAAEAIRAHTRQLRGEILELKKQKDNYITRLRTLLESHRNVVDGFEEDFAEVDREIEAIGRKVEEDVTTPPPASRMSRERIEEDFAHQEPEEKVTWGDDQPREDVERPTVPRPGQWEPKSPGQQGSPEDVQPGQDEKAEQEEETASSPQLDFGPVSAAAEVAEDGGSPDAGDEELDGEALARDVVANSLGERMSPGDRMRGEATQVQPPAGQAASNAPVPEMPTQAAPAQGAPVAQAGPAPARDAAAAAFEPEMPGAATAVDPEPPAPASSDDWKAYEVSESKQDWSSYEVPRQAGRPPQPAAQPEGKPAMDGEPTDHEVEEALSGLTEMSSGQQAGPGTPEAQVPPAKARPAQPAPEAAEAEEAGAAGGDQKWSMEELRRNLTNMDRDS